MGWKWIVSIINSDLEKDAADGNNIKKIHFSTVCGYLKEFYWSPKKLRKSFYLPEQ